MTIGCTKCIKQNNFKKKIMEIKEIPPLAYGKLIIFTCLKFLKIRNLFKVSRASNRKYDKTG